MTWFDTHCHIAEPAFDDDREDVLARAWTAGVVGMIAVGVDGAASRRALDLADRDARIHAAVGLHPHEAARHRTELPCVRELALAGKAVAIGEIGLDFHYDFADRSDQMEAVGKQLELARETELPVILHVRDAEDEMRSLLRDVALPAGGVWHCFTASPTAAEEAMAAGLHLGFGGIITFGGAKHVAALAATVPLDRIVLETDAPFLAPVPHRGRRNEPAHVSHVGRRLAAARAMKEEELGLLTTANARALFRITLEPTINRAPGEAGDCEA